MSKSARPQRPVAPIGMEMLFFYPCPACGRHVVLGGPVQAALVQCDGCGKRFPIVPVDERTLHFLNIMLAGGKAAADPDFL